MNVSLTPELEQYVQEKVSSGLYYSASEVIREGLRLLRSGSSFNRCACKNYVRIFRQGWTVANQLLNMQAVKEKARQRRRQRQAQ